MKMISAEEVYENYDMSNLIEHIEKAYRQIAKQRARQPERLFMKTSDGGDLLVGPAYLGDKSYFGTKLSSYSPKNADTDLPMLSGVIALFDSENGQLVALVDAVSVTALRTGAKSAVAVKYLASERSETLGIVGMGTQAKTHCEAISCIRDISKILLWTRNPKEHKDLVKFINEKLNIETQILETPDEVASNCDILVSATWSKKPLVKTEAIKAGTLVIGLNHFPDATDFKASLLKKSKVCIDTKGALHSGTIQNALEEKAIRKDDIEKLSKIVIDEKDRKVKKDEFVYFQSAGASIEDVAGAVAIYQNL